MRFARGPRKSKRRCWRRQIPNCDVKSNRFSRTALAATLGQATGGDTQARIFLRADKVVPYGDLMEVMNLLRDAGFLKIALVGVEKTS